MTDKQQQKIKAKQKLCLTSQYSEYPTLRRDRKDYFFTSPKSFQSFGIICFLALQEARSVLHSKASCSTVQKTVA